MYGKKSLGLISTGQNGSVSISNDYIIARSQDTIKREIENPNYRNRKNKERIEKKKIDVEAAKKQI